MAKKDYSKLYGEYKLFFRYATRYNCLETDQLGDAEKGMYSNYIINMFQNMNVDELIYIYSKYVAFTETLNKLIKMWKENSESVLSSKYDDAFIKFTKNGFHTLTEEEKENYRKSRFYIKDEIARELNFSRNMYDREIEKVEHMVNGMAEELKKAIDKRFINISPEEISELMAKHDDLFRETMMLVGNLGKEFDNDPQYNDLNRQLNVYNEYLKKVELGWDNSTKEQLKTVSSDNESERVFVSENEYIENGTHYHSPTFDEETHIQLK